MRAYILAWTLACAAVGAYAIQEQMALAAILGGAAPGRGHRCEPYAETCRGSVIYTCVAGRWRRGIDCARAGRRDRVTVCSREPDGSAICVEDGGAS